MLTCEWYDSEDLKFTIEKSFTGNSDGVIYLSQGSYGTGIGKDNSQISLGMVFGIGVTGMLFFIAFVIYQIYISKTELRSKNSPISISDYAVEVSGINKN